MRILTKKVIVASIFVFLIGALPFVAVAQAPTQPQAASISPAAQAAAKPEDPSSPVTAMDQLIVPGGPDPVPIVVVESTVPLEERITKKITLDVRDMSVIDVLRFLALKGDFNLVTASTVQGRATFYLKSVSIKDALNIAVLSNHLAYAIEDDIVHVMTEEEFSTQYGKTFSDKREVEIVHLQYAKPSYVLSTLDGVKSSIGQIIVDEDTGNVVLIDTQASIKRMKKTLLSIEQPLEPITYALQYAKADVVAEKLRGRVDQQAVGSITVDERTNQLVIRALAGRKDEVLSIIKDLDSPTKEVLIEVRVLSVVFNPSYDVGIDWSLAFSNSPIGELRKLQFKNISLDEGNLTSSDKVASKYARIAVGTFGVNDFATAIRAVKEVSDTKLVANPKLLVTNQEEAKIHVGDTVPYIVSTTSGTGDNAIHSEDVRFVDVGLKLSVTPTINDNGYVTMALKPEISTVTKSITSQGGGIPQITKTEVETNVMVKDGMTIVLGGLKKEQKVLSRKGVPVLMDIPIIQNFFSSRSESIESSETVIFITPHIVTGKENHPERRGAVIKPSKEYKDLEMKELQPKVGIKP
jgi:type II secretory pathway component GspD/PulD (secretin)